MDRHSFFETNASKALFMATYRCPENKGKGYKVLLLVDNAKTTMDEIKWRITGISEYNDLSRKQLDMWDDSETLLKNLKIVKMPLEKRTVGNINKLTKKMNFNPDFVIGSIEKFFDYRLIDFIADFEQTMAIFDERYIKEDDKDEIARMLLDESKKNKKKIDPTTKSVIDEIIETHKMVESLDVFYNKDTGAIKLAGFPYRGAKNNLAEESCIKHLLMFENVHTNCDLSKTNKWFISNCINIVRNHRDQKFEIVV